MGWDRQAPHVVQAPQRPLLSRWLLAAFIAVLACVLLFLLLASERVPMVYTLNIWALSASPLMVWILGFAARACAYGNALNHYQFLQAQAQDAQYSWQGWAQRCLAVSASCVLLPDQVSASVMVQRPFDLPPRTGQARSLAALPAHAERAPAGLQMLIQALGPALHALPTGQELRVTLLSDVDPSEYESLRLAWQQAWAITIRRALPATLTLASEFSYCWIDETLKAASTAIELILVLQVHGEDAYSDGLAALLLCPDSLAVALELPITASLLRPMPLNIETLGSELPLFLQTQVNACQATAMLADAADWQPLTGKILVGAGAHGASLNVEQLWIQESLCGPSGPLGHWLVAALGAEMVRHQQSPLLILAREQSQHWIGTVTTGDRT